MIALHVGITLSRQNNACPTTIRDVVVIQIVSFRKNNARKCAPKPLVSKHIVNGVDKIVCVFLVWDFI